MRRANSFAGIFAALAAIVFFIPAMKMHFLDSKGMPAAGFLPVVLSVLLFLMGIALVIKSLRSSDDSEFSIGNKKVFWRAMAIIIAMPFIMFYFGFLPAALLCVFLFSLNIGIKPVKAVIATLLIVFVIYFLFKYGLSVSLPKGKLF